MNAIKTKTIGEFSKYEKARILGARALQISMDAPILSKIDKGELDNLNFDPLRIAEIEVNSGVLPISVKRPMPERKQEDLGKIKVEADEGDEVKIKTEKQEEKEIREGGEIMGLVKEEDEDEGFVDGNSNDGDGSGEE